MPAGVLFGVMVPAPYIFIRKQSGIILHFQQAEKRSRWKKGLTSRFRALDKVAGMKNVERIHKDKSSTRPHYVPEWAALRGMRQVDLVNATGIDKSLVSKWWGKKVAPQKGEHIEALGAALQLEDPFDIFRDPDDDWIRRFFQNRSEEERRRAIDMLKLMFPDQPFEIEKKKA